MEVNRFNVRVYGIFIYKGKVLITDEFRQGMKMTKFPGGALEFGEGTIDCLKREFMEETGQDIEIVRHFYTTDYYQPTKLIPETQQLINIYYLVKLNEPFNFTTVVKQFDFDELIDGAQTFRWLDFAGLSPDDVSLPIDKKVVKMLKEELKIEN